MRVRSLILAVVGALALGVGAPAATALTILYDLPEAVEEIAGPTPTPTELSAVHDDLYQQGTVQNVLGPGRVSAKVASGAGSLLTPSLAGLEAPAIATVLAAQIDGSPSRLVFLDELDASFQGAAGERLAGALAELATRPFPGGGTYADRVHLYVRTVRAMLVDPPGWAAAWRAVSLAGGAWLETYLGSSLPVSPWGAELWLHWPRAFRAEMVARGGRPDRLHLLISSGVAGDQAAQWALARTGQDPGSACAVLASRPGAYRLSSVPGSPSAWAVEYRASFPAPGGTPVGCSPSPLLAPALAAALGDPAAPGLFSLERLGSALPEGSIAGGPLLAGGTSTITVRLPGGADPLGIAGRLAAAGGSPAAAPAAFWPGARANVVARGDGLPTVTAPIAQAADGSWQATLTLSPAAPAALRLTLEIGGGAVRAALGPPSDLVVSLLPWTAADPALQPTVTRVARDPLNWRLAVPLGSSTDPLAPALAAVAPAPPPPPPPPGILSLAPPGATAGDPDLAVLVAGSGVAPGAVVRWNGADRPTSVVGDDALAVAIPASDLAAPGSATLQVVNPDGQASAPVPFLVATPPAPAPRSRPALSGAPVVGARLRCSSGVWDNRPTRYDRIWLRAGRPISAATGTSYRIAPADLGSGVSCRVTATNLGGAVAAESGRRRPPALGVRVRLGKATSGRPLVVSVRANQPVPGALLAIQQRVGRRFVTIATAPLRGRERRVGARLRLPPRRPLTRVERVEVRVVTRLGRILLVSRPVVKRLTPP